MRAIVIRKHDNKILRPLHSLLSVDSAGRVAVMKVGVLPLLGRNAFELSRDRIASRAIQLAEFTLVVTQPNFAESFSLTSRQVLQPTWATSTSLSIGVP